MPLLQGTIGVCGGPNDEGKYPKSSYCKDRTIIRKTDGNIGELSTIYRQFSADSAVLSAGTLPSGPFCSQRRAAARSLRAVAAMSFQEKYWQYSLFVLIVGLGVTIVAKLTPFLGGLLGAATIYVLLRGQMWYLTERKRWRRSLAASLLMAEAVFLFLVPVSLVIWMLVARIQDIALDPQSVVAPLRHAAELLQERFGYDLWQESNLQSALAMLPKVGQWIVAGIADFALNLVVLLFVLYFMLIGGTRMEAYVRDMLPFNRSTGRQVMREIHMIVRSNAIGIPLLAIVQGIVAYAGYLLFGAPSPLFWGVVTCFATIIPIIGTGLVWVPLSAYMALDGRWGAAIGLCLFGMLVVTHVDNVVRFVMQKKLADTHPLVTIFGVFVGLSLFGFMGVIFGPLMLAMFIFCVDLFKRRYLEQDYKPS